MKETLRERFERLRNNPECRKYDDEHEIMRWHQQILNEVREEEKKKTKWQKFKRFMNDVFDTLGYV